MSLADKLGFGSGTTKVTEGNQMPEQQFEKAQKMSRIQQAVASVMMVGALGGVAQNAHGESFGEIVRNVGQAVGVMGAGVNVYNQANNPCNVSGSEGYGTYGQSGGCQVPQGYPQQGYPQQGYDGGVQYQMAPSYGPPPVQLDPDQSAAVCKGNNFTKWLNIQNRGGVPPQVVQAGRAQDDAACDARYRPRGGGQGR